MEPGIEKTQRVVYFDALRVFASFAVMLLHLAAQHWADVPVDGEVWRAFNVWDALVRWCVPVFVMISGALFLARPIPLRKLYGKHIARIAAAFVFWSGLYALVSARRYDMTVPQLVVEWIQGHYHLWFLYMIAGLYLVTPLLYRLTQSEESARYFLLLAFVFGFLLPELLPLLALHSPRLGGALNAALGYADLRFVGGFSGYFVLGHRLNRRTLNRREETAIYVLGVLGLLFTALGTRALSVHTGASNSLLYGYCTVNVLAEAAAVFTLFKQHVRSTSRLLGALSGASFGAYLIHALFLDTLQFRFDVDTLSFPAQLSVPLLAAAVFVLSYAASYLLGKVPLIKDYLI